MAEAQLMMIWRNPSTGEIYYPASYVERLRAALATIADSADFKDFAENEAAWMQGVARRALGSADGLAVGCHRSHPHENMNAECQRLTEVARRNAHEARSSSHDD